MALVLRGLGETADESSDVVIRRVDANVLRLVTQIDADAQRRKITLILTGVGVLFAAAKLGFVAVPHFLQWRRSK